jgi:hypothetical protein
MRSVGTVGERTCINIKPAQYIQGWKESIRQMLSFEFLDPYVYMVHQVFRSVQQNVLIYQ